MKRILSIVLALFMLLPTFNLLGCAKTQDQQATNVIRVCNCEDYIDKSLLEEFTNQTGIEVIYSTYGTNENLYNELVINPNSYDLVVPSEYMIEKLAVEGRLNKLDFNNSRLQDYQNNLSPFIQERLKGIQIGQTEESIYDYMVGYMWGTMGWVYNTEKVSEEDVKSWDAPFKNPSLSKKITIKDAVRDSYIVGLAMAYKEELQATNDNAKISEILNRTDKDSIKLVGDTLTSLKDKLFGFEVDSGKNDIVLGRIDAYVAWSGDAAYAIDVAAGLYEDEDVGELEKEVPLSYYIPDEGSNIWFDGFVMPSGSENYDVVYKFLEFISSSSSVYANMNYTGYTSMIARGEDFEVEDEEGNLYTTNLFDEVVLGWFDESEDLEEGEGITVDLSYFFGGSSEENSVVVSEEGYGRLIAQYPSEKEVSRCAVMSYFGGEELMAINEMWEHVKGETLPTEIIVITIVIVVLLAVLMIAYRNKEKLSFLKLPERKTTYAQRKGLKLISREYKKY